MKAFDFDRPTTLGEAVALKAAHGHDAQILAGGQSLINMMKWRLVAPARLIDATRVQGLSDVHVEADTVRIGSMVRYAKLSQAVPTAFGAIHDALEVIADMQVRNLGTLGGSCCQADPFGDMPNVMVALAAEMTATSQSGKRQIGADDFFQGPLQTALEPDEILTEIALRTLPGAQGSAYEKFSWRRGDFVIVSAASSVAFDDADECSHFRLVIGGLGLGPVRLRGLEAAALGTGREEVDVEQLSEAASRQVEPEDDPIYGSADYKRELVKTMATRSLHRSISRSIKAGD